ncbi:hypothetical protein O181_056740 [Austropuccinia psidii MF-1]|uniref:Uncharacterized protein n=1 Tax=Austropuccinia psidii MF-1 TaxID=1389203 RepID=A0A9Q3ED89_9BASI|nr:hypothetical protein [Austropuccinia psidii MF-1]
MPPTQLTILTLAECPPNTAYHPYACIVPSRHASNTAYHPYARGVPSQHAPNTAHHPYARCPPDMPSTQLTILTLAECPPKMLPALLTIFMLAECPPDTTYDPYACVVPFQHCLPSLRLWSALPKSSQHHS